MKSVFAGREFGFVVARAPGIRVDPRHRATDRRSPRARLRRGHRPLRCASEADGILQPATRDTDVAEHGVVETGQPAQIALHPDLASEAGDPARDRLESAPAPSCRADWCDG